MDYGNSRIVFAALSLAFFISIAATDIVLPSLPTLAAEFQSSADGVQLAIPLYLVTNMVMAPLWGFLSDFQDLRLVLMRGLCVFVLGSIICIFAPSLSVFLAGRIIQGLGSIAIPVAGYTLIHEMYEGRKATQAIAWLGSVMALSPMFAPVLGGILQEWLGWQSIFYFLVLFAAPAAFVFMKELKRRPFYGDAPSSSFIESILNYRFALKNVHFVGFVLAFGVISCGEWIYFTISPFYFQSVIGVEPVIYGLLLFISTAFYLIGNVITTRLLRNNSNETVLFWGTIVTALGGIALVLCALLTPLEATLIACAFAVFVMGSAMVWAPSTSLALTSVSKGRGSASALRSLLLSGSYATGGFIGAFLNDYSLWPLSIALLITAMISFGIVYILRLRG